MSDHMENLWDGDSPLRPGLVVKYNGTPKSEFYSPPLPGTLITLIAEDYQMEYNQVWICRWYDEEKRIKLCPLLPSTFERVKEPIDNRTLLVADKYYEITGQTLNNVALDEALAFLLVKDKHEVTQKGLEVTLKSDGAFFPLADVEFPVTLRLYPGEYKTTRNRTGIHIRGDILNMIPGAAKGEHSFSDEELYYFYTSEATY